ncbi:MAG: lysostaphin resistance A-like protein [Planctomycetota bacterium]|jgi:membrane protease YdiL (CAAX protease family)
MSTDILQTIRELGKTITIADLIICLPGFTLLGIWLLRTSLGKKALADSLPRRNSMPIYLPLIPLFIWLGVFLVLTFFKEVNLPDLPDWQSSYFDHLFLCIGALVGIMMILILARRHFARRLKGLGLGDRRILRDFAAAVLNLIAVYPLVAVALILTIFTGKLIHGPEFQMQKHQELELVVLHSQLELRVLIIITVIFVMPAFEEMLFRGLFQTVIRSLLETRSFSERLQNEALTPWLSVALSSCLFAAVHANAGHWPALFVLAMCMGYAYEKSGSLYRPIFIHSLFNATSIVFALNQPVG